MAYYQGVRLDDDEGIDLSVETLPGLRGAITFDADFSEVMIDAGVDEVAEAVAELKGGVVTPYEVDDAELAQGGTYYPVFRLKGVGWTYLHRQSNDPDRPNADEFVDADLAILSGRLDSRVIRFGVSDTAAAVGYSFYNRGVLRESFDSVDYAAYRFESRDRQVELDDIDAEEFADEFLLTQDALLAGMGFLSYGSDRLKPETLPAEYDAARFVIGPRRSDAGTPRTGAARPKVPKTPK